MADNVEIEGMDNLIKKLEALGGTVLSIRKEMVQNMGDVADMMARKAPTDTEKLKPNIQVKDDSTDTELLVKAGIFAESAINYAIYQEYGTGIYAENGQGRQTPWLWQVKSQKWADIFGIEVGQSVLWHGNQPHPFIRPAWDENKDKIEEKLRTALLKQIEVISSA
jgi:HK97 gp10 family phage protein